MNEYLEKFNDLKEKSTFKGQQWFGKRRDLVEEYSWAVPNEDVLTYLAEFDNIVEIGAGNGYWANCIEENGGSVEPYDISPPENTWTSVGQEDVRFMSDKYFSNPILLVWPALNKGVATKVAEQCAPHILYVGEPRGGCTGDEMFFDILDEQYGLVAKIDLPSYVGVHDDFYHYVRKV